MIGTAGTYGVSLSDLEDLKRRVRESGVVLDFENAAANAKNVTFAQCEENRKAFDATKATVKEDEQKWFESNFDKFGF